MKKIDIIISPTTTVTQAMKMLEKTHKKCLMVVDDKNMLLGTLTDGDIRRSILSGIAFSEQIESFLNTKPIVLLKEEYSDIKARQLLKNEEIDLIPIVDNNFVVVDYVTWVSLDKHDSPSKTLENVPVVIMAGGKGTRLEPFTKILPKPLIPVQEKPIIEHIIKRFTDLGCKEFYVTVNYKGRILKAYFEELQPEYKVHFIEESEPLGTGGSLSLLEGKFNQPFFVTNCDTIVKTDYNELYKFHQKGVYDITLVASTKEYIMPYGTCELDGDGHLSHIVEKPKYDFLVNTGLYVLNPEVLKIIPKNNSYQITQLIEDTKNIQRKVGIFPIDDDAWIDVGQWGEYRRTIEKL